MGLLRAYTRWLHTRWPAGRVEPLPEVREDGSTAVPGLYVTGDLTGIPLLKFATDTGARAVERILSDPAFRRSAAAPDAAGRSPLDLVIVGAGVSGMSAALEAREAGLTFEVLEASEPFSTIVNFPRAKPIFTYPTGMKPAGRLQLTGRSSVKEGLVEELKDLTLSRGIRPRMARAVGVERGAGFLEVVLADGSRLAARRVIIAIGRSGSFRRLGVPGEELGKVSNRLHDPRDYAGMDVLVVGGGDSAVETAIAIAQCGGRVTLSFRSGELTRPKPENLDKLRRMMADPASSVRIESPVSERVTTAAGEFLGPRAGQGNVRLLPASRVREIREREAVVVLGDGRVETLPNDAVFTMIGREAPLEFFRRSGIRIRGKWTRASVAGFAAFLLLCVFVYNWKAPGRIYGTFHDRGWFPFNLPGALEALGEPSSLLGTLRVSLGSPGFHYSLAYTLLIAVFGIRRIRRRRTPYITAQTLTLMAVQIVPLFLLPYLLLPWAGHNGWFDDGAGRWLADQLFPVSQWEAHGREYWRAFGLILAWPLFIWNVFSHQPLWLWLAICAVQTFVLIPLMIYFWGKGSYCGWICSCGALAETLGDTHRHRMPHGPFWNRLNMTGQVVLAAALLIAVLRIASWTWPGSAAAAAYDGMLNGWSVGYGSLQIQTNYYWLVDVTLAGIIGLGAYFWLSGRVWCRFACPLAALMHIYARFSRFRILAEKKKCISCNVCTSVCHQGIDVMSFANKGMPMSDPECVRCSACVQSCPTGTLEFGQVDPSTLVVIRKDRLAASPVLMAEGRS